MDLFIATKNPAKSREFKEFLGDSFRIVSLADIGGSPDMEETGETFEENSLLKAKFYFEGLGIPVIADDGGLAIDYLNGEPGVKSRRWPGYEASDQELIDMVLQKLKGVSWEQRTASFKIVLTFYDTNSILQESASTEGYITEKQIVRCEPGFPFRTIFWVTQFGKIYQDLTPDEHRVINHRRFACEKIKQKILKLAK
ncbi:MAG: non-canonical purine NTP pyrophosphatase [Candidatus Yanofskybacteria bacterium]|nr:non-canonical purine NTP pyrophosphatase [Candidatus Yanofskybacteria bacterium]